MGDERRRAARGPPEPSDRRARRGRLDRLERDRRVPERQRRVHLRPERRLDRAHRPVVHDARRAHRRATGVADRVWRRRAGGALTQGRAVDDRDGRPAVIRLARQRPDRRTRRQGARRGQPEGHRVRHRRGRVDAAAVRARRRRAAASTPCPKLGAHQLAAVGERAVVFDEDANTLDRRRPPRRASRRRDCGSSSRAPSTTRPMSPLPQACSRCRSAAARCANSTTDRRGRRPRPRCRGTGAARRLRARRVGGDRTLPLRLRRRRADAARHRAAHRRVTSRVPRQPRRHRAEQPHQRQRLARRLRPAGSSTTGRR